MVPEAIRVRPIDTVSPSLAETLRECKLRAGLSRARGAGRYALGNPKAWLGTAYHAVLEGVGPECEDDIETYVEERWRASIETRYESVRVHRLDKRFGPPESWPGYYRVAAMALVRAKELLAVASGRGKGRDSWSSGRAGNRRSRERRLTGAGGKLVGRPDLVRRYEVVDFKTGEVFEDEASDQVRAAYARQLRLYAFLVNETLGWWPRRGVLQPMAGGPVVVELEREKCEAEAGEAIRLLDKYNEVLGSGADAVELANASPSSCRWCQYQLYCPAFWRTVEPAWKEGLSSDAVAGRAMGPPSPIHDGAAFSLSLEIEQGTEAPGALLSLSPLQSSEHIGLNQIRQGDRVGVTGLWRRADERLTATRRALVGHKAALPRIEIGSDVPLSRN